MDLTEARVGVEHVDETVRIAVSGEIDLANAGSVENLLLDAVSNRTTAVSIDLGGLSYIDSAGLRVLFELGTRLRTLQTTFELIVPVRSPARRAIELSGLDSVAAVSPSVS